MYCAEDFEIIDFHTHPFLRDTCNWCMYPGAVPDMERFQEDLTAAGISRFAGSVIERVSGAEFAEINRLNQDALCLKKRLGDKYIPGVHIHPGFVEESCGELFRMHDAGVRLVGELVPYAMDWKHYYDEELRVIYQCIEALGMVVSLHTQEEDSIDRALHAFPGITFVAAHPGEKEVFLRHLERMKRYPNYYLDLSGTGIFRYGSVAYGVKEVGNSRFLFGTDYPICNAGMYVNAVLHEHLEKDDLEAIFSGNAKRLLGL